MSEFIWTDDLAIQFAKFFKRDSSHNFGPSWENELLERFKFIKQPKQEWEILQGWHGDINGGIHDWLGRCSALGCKIHSVRRLSDGEVFTVGDDIGFKFTNQTRKIQRFRVTDNGKYISAFWGEDVNQGCILQDIHHITPEPLPVYLTPSEIEKLKNLLK